MEQFAPPSITHHVYLKNVGDKVFLNTEGDYPRLVLEKCETCSITVERANEKDIVIVNGDGSKKVQVSPQKTTRVPDTKEVFLTSWYYGGNKQIRVFVHDLAQKKLSKKRQRKFYGYSKDWVVKAKLLWLPQPEPVTIQRSDGTSKLMQKVGQLVGALEGKDFSLSVYNYGDGDSYKEEKETMLLFRDFSNGKETYGAGRFLDVKFPTKMGNISEGSEVEVDFNFSYNPPCAVSTGYHCPLPQDMVGSPVRAGEKYAVK